MNQKENKNQVKKKFSHENICKFYFYSLFIWLQPLRVNNKIDRLYLFLFKKNSFSFFFVLVRKIKCKKCNIGIQL